jgi:outer membrane protein insertion porin family
MSPLGALTISAAKALNEKDGDETEVFQFQLGQTF